MEAVEEKLTEALKEFKVQHKVISEENSDDSYAHIATLIVTKQKEKEKGN